ncbi:MAG: 30S ribosomal protein S9, partial [Gammaproteobacteria bacterium]
GPEFFRRYGDVDAVLAPLKAVGLLGKYSVSLRVTGGGNSGQVGAAQLAVARALLKLNPDLRKPLRKGGYLSRDDREKERKKPGLKRARKRPTYTKR